MALTRRAGDVDANLAQPEVHIIGEIVGGEGFGKGVSCKFVVQTGPAWKFLQGNQSGQTQVDYPAGGGKLAVWAHPLDLHYTTLTTEVRNEQKSVLLAGAPVTNLPPNSCYRAGLDCWCKCGS